jgi:hypothetical protein
MKKLVKKIGSSYCITFTLEDRMIFGFGKGDVIDMTITNVKQGGYHEEDYYEGAKK